MTAENITSRVPSHGAHLGLAGHPQGLRMLYFSELWERFSYYGMRALLTLFMVAPAAEGGLGFANVNAARIYGNYTMAVYMVAILGGFIADRVIGAKKAVLTGGWIIALGHYVLALPMHSTFYLGLILIVLGTGLFKPNISALVGALYAKDDGRRDAGFSLFYMGVNIGAFVSPLVTGFLAQSVTFKQWLASAGFDPAKSWHWGFAAAGIGMTLAMILFSRGSADLKDPGEPDAALDSKFWQSAVAVTLATLALLAIASLSDSEGFLWLRWTFIILPLAAIAYFLGRGGDDNNRLAAIGVLFIAAMIFFAVFEQMGSSMSLFADQLSDNRVLGQAFPSSWYQSINPIFVIFLAPVFAYAWMRLGSRQPSAAVKFALGLGFVAASFLFMAPAATLAGAGKVSPLWLVGLFLLQTIGELFLSPVGLSTMTKLAPPRLSGLVLGVWFLAAAFGNKLAGVLGGSFDSDNTAGLAQFYLTQAAYVGAAALLLLVLSPWVKRLSGLNS